MLESLEAERDRLRERVRALEQENTEIKRAGAVVFAEVLATRRALAGLRPASFRFGEHVVTEGRSVPPEVERAMLREAQRYAALGHIEAELPEEADELDPELVIGP